MTIIKMDYFYFITGIILLVNALRVFKSGGKAIGGLFWLIYTLLFIVGDMLPDSIAGILVVIMIIIAGMGVVKPIGVKTVTQQGSLRDNRVFIPALAIPVITLFCIFILKDIKISGVNLFEPKHITLVGIGLGCILSLVLACIIYRDSPINAFFESSRLLDAISYPIVLPQLLAMLGIVFASCGVGTAVAYLVNTYLDVSYLFAGVAIYVFGMAILTILVGNAFVAFPVMMSGVGIPVLIHSFHADPAIVASMGMLSGYCGTLMTPMAANFNIVPAALLELPDKNQIIRVQFPTGAIILLVNLILLYLLLKI